MRISGAPTPERLKPCPGAFLFIKGTTGYAFVSFRRRSLKTRHVGELVEFQQKKE